MSIDLWESILLINLTRKNIQKKLVSYLILMVIFLVSCSSHQTYVSTTIGIKINYPSNWSLQVDETLSSIRILSQDMSIINIHRIERNIDVVQLEIIESVKHDENQEIINTQQLMIGDLDATQWDIKESSPLTSTIDSVVITHSVSRMYQVSIVGTHHLSYIISVTNPTSDTDWIINSLSFISD